MVKKRLLRIITIASIRRFAVLVSLCLVFGVTPSLAMENWKQAWERTLADAKKEGKLVVLNSFGGEGRNAIAKAFKKKYGIDMEFVTGRTGEIDTKMSTERRAGLYLEDVYMAGTGSLWSCRKLGFLAPLKPVIMLPEALDRKAWAGGQLNFADKDGLILNYQKRAVSAITVNGNIVKPGEIKSYKDLLAPKWKGKIVVMDPTKGSSGTIFFLVLWEIMGPDFTREFGKQDLAVTGDARQQAEWLARGKYPVSGTISSDIMTEFIKSGVPMKVILPAEGTVTAVAKGAVALIDKAPHPNAAKVLINWLLTREAQTLMSQINGDPSLRLDVSQEWVDPAVRIQQGMRYIDSDTEEMMEKRKELQKVSKEVWNIGR